MLDLKPVPFESESSCYPPSPFAKVNALSFDTAFKRFFSRRRVLAAIMKYTVKPFMRMKVSDIMKHLTPCPGNEDFVELLNGDDVYGDEVAYDILVAATKPNGTMCNVELHFELETQCQSNLRYSVANRSEYYTARMLARQSVKNSGYGKLFPVYSVWICMKGVPEELQNSVSFTNVYEENSKCGTLMSGSLQHRAFIYTSEHYDWDKKDSDVIKLIQAIFKGRLYDPWFNSDIIITCDVMREAKAISDKVTKYLLDDEWARKKTAAEGREEGRAEGIAEARLDTLLNLLAIGMSKEQILAAKFTEEEYKKALNVKYDI